MRKSTYLLLGLLSLTACMTDNQSSYPGTVYGKPHAYSRHGSYNDNGVTPAPNNGNQNFGRRW